MSQETEQPSEEPIPGTTPSAYQRLQARGNTARDIIRPYVIRVGKFVRTVFNRILPPYEPRINLEEKLVDDEEALDSTVIYYLSEAQLLLGLFLMVLGIFLPSVLNISFLYFLLLAGALLILTCYELEEICITSRRLLIRRIGMVERILRIPSDEEHLLVHIVSYKIGRAPINWPVTLFGLIGYLSLFVESIPDFYELLIIIASTIILLFGLRINRRALTIFFAGGHHVILGLRKGVPKRILSTFQTVLYYESGELRHQPVFAPPEEEMVTEQVSSPEETTVESEEE